jgi:hypothetical protein
LTKLGSRYVTVVLAGSLLAAPCGAAPPDDAEICGRLSQEIAKVTEAGKASQGGSVMSVLADDSGGFVRFEREELLEGADAIKNALRERYQLTDADADKIDDGNGTARAALTIMASAHLAVVGIEGGTAHCSSFQFFDVSGPASAVAAPEDPAEGYCLASSVGEFASLGEIGGRPGFVVESFADANESIRVFIRQDDRWSKSCSLAVTWKPDFAVKGEACRGETCPDLKQAAMDAVSRYDAAHDVLSFWTRVPLQATPGARKARFADYLAGALGGGSLRSWPTNPAPILAGAQYRTIAVGDDTITMATITGRARFADHDEHRDFAIADDRTSQAVSVVDMSEIYDGRESDADAVLNDMSGVPHDSSYPFTGFNSDSVVVPVAAGGRNYLARVGHGWFAWRMTDDYLVNVLEPDGVGNIRRAAGFLVGKTRGREVSVRSLESINAPEPPSLSAGSGQKKTGNTPP